MRSDHLKPRDQNVSPGHSDVITRIIQPQVHDLGGFTVRRALPNAKQRMVGPWIFFDHMGPASFAPGQGIDVRPHPHINLATVTYLFDGEMLHRDSLGNELVIKPGEINLMVAGKGIVHSERQREAVKQRTQNRLHGLQLWLALPEKDEEMDAEFHHYGNDQIPQAEVNEVALRVLIGEAYGLRSPVKTFARTLYFEADLKAGQALSLPSGEKQMALYVVKGEIDLQGTTLESFTLSVIESDQAVEIVANEPSHIVVIGGEKLSRRHIWWNFVSSRRQRIEQARQDWLNSRFDKVPGDEEEFIPLPED